MEIAPLSSDCAADADVLSNRSQAAPAPISTFAVDKSACVPLPYRLCDVVTNGTREFEPWVASAAASLETRLPIPPSSGPFQSNGFFRIDRHQRSICFAPKAGSIRSVFCIKGMEPLAPDFPAALDRLAARRPLDRGLNALEYFILKEDKLPNCVLFGEAQAEASTAATVQMRLAADGEPPPRLPLPVACVRLPQATVEFAVREITARASRSLWRKIEMLAAGGLGAYVYWYPSIPLRAAQFRSSRQMAVAMSEGWMNVAARLLRAGFLPTSAYSLDRGHCCDARNAVIDGGFVDLGSVVPVADVPAQEDVLTALQITVRWLAAAILLVLGRDENQVGQFDYVGHMIVHLVRERLARACAASGEPGLAKFSGALGDLGAAARLLDPT